MNGNKNAPFHLCTKGTPYQSELFDRTISNRACFWDQLSMINAKGKSAPGFSDLPHLYQMAWIYAVRLLRDPMFPHHEHARAILMLGKQVPKNIQNAPKLVLCVKDPIYDDEILKMLNELTLNPNAQIRTQAKDCIKTIELAKKNKAVKEIPSEDEYEKYCLRVLESPDSWKEEQEQAIKYLMKIAERKRSTQDTTSEICKRLDKVISNKENEDHEREQARKLREEFLKKYAESGAAGS